LIIQLKRFEYNPKKEAMVKINDSFEFYNTIDLNKFMSSPQHNNNIYSLHSVVVHQGSANSGHYYAFIKPKLEDNWILFNDETVRPADKYEVYNNNFGGTSTFYKLKQNGDILKNEKYVESNAYVLVYIRNSLREQILCPLLEQDVI
jgi:ubiquitin carboxyl-terminal hydrolase 7